MIRAPGFNAPMQGHSARKLVSSGQNGTMNGVDTIGGRAQ
jgi:hypothetical protein